MRLTANVTEIFSIFGITSVYYRIASSENYFANVVVTSEDSHRKRDIGAVETLW